MFAGILAAWKALSPLIRYGSMAGFVALVIGGYFGWRAYQQHLGKEKQDAIYQAELTKQSIAANQQTVRQSDIGQQTVSDLIAINHDLRAKLDAVQQELADHANATTKQACPIDPDAVRIVNDLARVLNESTSDQRVPAAGEAPRRAPVEAEASVTATPDAVYLLERIRLLTEREAVTDAAHRKLSDYVLEQYRSDYEYYYGLVAPAE